MLKKVIQILTVFVLVSATVRAQDHNFQEKEVFRQDTVSLNQDSLLTAPVEQEVSQPVVFAPDPMKAVWYSALFPDWDRSITVNIGNCRL